MICATPARASITDILFYRLTSYRLNDPIGPEINSLFAETYVDVTRQQYVTYHNLQLGTISYESCNFGSGEYKNEAEVFL